MLRLTEQAARWMIETRREYGIADDRLPRLVIEDGEVKLTFAVSVSRVDQAVTAGSLTVYCAPEAAARLDRAVIDARPEGSEMILVIREVPIMQPISGRIH